MNNENLELLIDAALLDGKITDREKEILRKKARELGVEDDEFELVLNSRILKYQRRANEGNRNSTKFGDLRKCPSCGAMIGSFLIKCPECGYEFSGVGPNLYVAEFSKALGELEKGVHVSTGFLDIFDSGELQDERKQKMIMQKEARMVKNYPMPMTKEDSLEMLYFMLPKTKFIGSNKATYAWRSKFFEILDRTEMYAGQDSELRERLRQLRNDAQINMLSKFVIWWKSLSGRIQVLTGFLLFYIVLVLFMLYMGM